MATGVQASTALTATTDTIVYTIPTGFTWTGCISVVNRGTSQAKIRLAFGTGSSLTAGQYVEYDFPLSPAGSPGNVLERTGIVMQAGHRILAYSDSSNVDVVVYGIEE